MAKKLHPEFGIVSERVFPATSREGQQLVRLETFNKEKILLGFSIDSEILTLWRSWVEGQAQDELFRGFSQNERISYSRELFRHIEGKLKDMRWSHGALHPHNIILQEGGGPVLVDAVFNSVSMNPYAVPKDDPWLWGPGLPKGWSLDQWDRVSLLRTVVLLAQEPSSWAAPRSREEVAELCRRWAQDLIDFYKSKPDYLSSVEEAVALLPKIVTADFEKLPSFPLEEELEALAARQGNNRVLSEKSEKDLRGRAARQGLESEQPTLRLQVWALRRGFQFERELRSLSRELLATGLYGESKKMVNARSCIAAERTFTYYGVDPKDAAQSIQKLLTDAGWIDERQAAQQCRQHLDNVKKLPDQANAESIAGELAAKHGYPPEVARRLVDLEIERHLLGLMP